MKAGEAIIGCYVYATSNSLGTYLSIRLGESIGSPDTLTLLFHFLAISHYPCSLIHFISPNQRQEPRLPLEDFFSRRPQPKRRFSNVLKLGLTVLIVCLFAKGDSGPADRFHFLRTFNET